MSLMTIEFGQVSAWEMASNDLPEPVGAQTKRFPSCVRLFVGRTETIWLRWDMPRSKLAPISARLPLRSGDISDALEKRAVCRWCFDSVKNPIIRLRSSHRA